MKLNVVNTYLQQKRKKWKFQEQFNYITLI